MSIKKLLGLAMLLTTAAFGQSSWSKVQTQSKILNYVSSITLPVTATGTNHVLVVYVTNAAQTAGHNTTTVITDNKSNTWTRALASGSYADPNSNATVDAWLCSLCTSGVTSISASVSGFGQPAFLSIEMEEFIPPTTVGITKEATASASVVLPATTQVGVSLTTTGNDLILVGGTVPGVSRVGSPFAIDAQIGNPNDTRAITAVASYSGTSFGTYTPAFQVGNSNNLHAAAVIGIALKAGSGTTSCGSSCGGALPTAPALILACPSNNGIITSAYTSSAAVTGGTSPFVWSFGSGSLPPGLSFDTTTGAVSGTPTATGTYSFGVGVVDSGTGVNAQTASASCSITISPTKTGMPDLSATFGGTCQVTANNKEGYTYEGTPCTITTATPTNYAVSGAGSLTCTANCTTTTYTPPSTVSGTYMKFGCPVNPVDNVYNANISTLPLFTNNTSIMTTFGVSNYFLKFVPSQSLSRATSATPARTFKFYYTPSLNAVLFPTPYRPDLERETGTYTNWGGDDNYWTVVNTDTCGWFEIFKDYATYSANGCAYPNCTAGSMFAWGAGYYDVPTSEGSTTGAGTSRTHLTWTAEDIRNGPKHAIESVGPNGWFLSRTINNGYVWPAQTPSFNTGCTDATTCIPYGVRWRLKASWVAANLTGHSALAQNMMIALRDYGSVVVDITTGGPGLEFDTSAYRDPQVSAAVRELGGVIPFSSSAVEFVDESALMDDAQTIRVAPSNTYWTPPNTTTITASGGNTARIAMGVLPVSVGTSRPLFAVLAGTPGQQLDSWVNGSSNQTVTWTHVSGPGTVTTNGVYTPPSSVGSTQTDVLTLSPRADPNTVVHVVVTVLQADSAHPNGFAIDVAGLGCSTSSHGCTRLYQSDDDTPQMGYINFPSFTGSTTSYPAFPSSTPDQWVWNTLWHSSGEQDFSYGPFMVPNGNYTVTYMSAAGNGCATITGTYAIGSDLSRAQIGPLLLDANNAVGGIVDFGQINNSGHQCGKPASYTIPAKVTDGFLYFAMRSLGTPRQGYDITNTGWGINTPQTVVQLNGITVDRDTSTAAHWSVDGEQATSVAAGGMLQLRQIDWWTGQHCPNPDLAMSNTSCTWSVDGIAGGNSTIGTVSATGLYIAPASLPTLTATHTISVTNGTYSANYSFIVPGSAYPVAF